MEFLYPVGKVSYKNAGFCMFIWFPIMLVAQHKEESYSKERTNPALNLQNRFLAQRNLSQSKPKKVYRPKVQNKNQAPELSSAENQTDVTAEQPNIENIFIGKMPERWLQLSSLLQNKLCFLGLETPKILAISGAKNSGKTLLVKMLARDLSLIYFETNVSLLSDRVDGLLCLLQNSMHLLSLHMNKKVLLHFQRCDEYLAALTDQNKYKFFDVVEQLIKKYPTAFIAIESRASLHPEIRSYVKSIVETIEVPQTTIDDKREIWRYYLDRIAFPTNSCEQLASRYSSLDPQDIYQITQRVARRSIVIKKNSYFSYSFEKLADEIHNYLSMTSNQASHSYIQ